MVTMSWKRVDKVKTKPSKKMAILIILVFFTLFLGPFLAGGCTINALNPITTSQCKNPLLVAIIFAIGIALILFVWDKKID